MLVTDGKTDGILTLMRFVHPSNIFANDVTLSNFSGKMTLCKQMQFVNALDKLVNEEKSQSLISCTLMLLQPSNVPYIDYKPLVLFNLTGKLNERQY